MDIRWNSLVSTRGRIGRRTFWILAGPLFLLLIAMAVVGLREAPDALEAWDTLYFFGFGFSVVFAIFGVRRLHDRGISGKWMIMVVAPFILAYLPPLFPFLYLTPFIIAIMLVIVGAAPGDPRANAYGLPGSGSPFPNERLGADTTQRGDRR
jgi:uncharacterized membrane protein YhaH (DUF805 family)